MIDIKHYEHLRDLFANTIADHVLKNLDKKGLNDLLYLINEINIYVDLENDKNSEIMNALQRMGYELYRIREDYLE